MVVLAFLDVGPTEALVIAGLFLVLFGADKLPAMAREAGRISAQVRGTARQFTDQMAREEQAFVPGDAVPVHQKQQVLDVEQNELARLQRAAADLGIDIIGKGPEELRAAIAEKVR
ncbi:MAG: twin-arginine translocase TatA/TatE family subunit [Halobacteriales archaeon]|nr:twin-arginine translocase TatA/TatE family subunit [Halobacteriales archaeon]